MADVRNAFSAPMAKLIADGNKVFAWATGITGTESITNVPIKVLGDLYTQQFAPVDISVSVQVDTIHISDQSLVKAGLWAQGSTVDVITFPPMTIDLYDQFADKPRARLHGCVCARRSVPLGRGGIAAESVSFDCIRLEILD